MIHKSSFSYLYEEAARKKVKVNLQDIYLTENIKSYREYSVNLENKYFFCDKYGEDSDNSSEDSKDSYEEYWPTKEQKCVFFKLLKCLLEDLGLLEGGMKRHCQYNQDTLRLVYMNEECKVIIEDSSRRIKWRCTVPTRHIYLKWRYDAVETLSLENLQNVQAEMRILNIQNKKLEACFNLAKINFQRELVRVRQNAKLEIYCQDDIFLTFVYGEGENVMKILYDDERNKPVYTIEIAHWYTKLLRFLYEGFCWLKDNFAEIVRFLVPLFSVSFC